MPRTSTQAIGEVPPQLPLEPAAETTAVAAAATAAPAAPTVEKPEDERVGRSFLVFFPIGGTVNGCFGSANFGDLHLGLSGKSGPGFTNNPRRRNKADKLGLPT